MGLFDSSECVKVFLEAGLPLHWSCTAGCLFLEQRDGNQNSDCCRSQHHGPLTMSHLNIRPVRRQQSSKCVIYEKRDWIESYRMGSFLISNTAFILAPKQLLRLTVLQCDRETINCRYSLRITRWEGGKVRWLPIKSLKLLIKSQAWLYLETVDKALYF